MDAAAWNRVCAEFGRILDAPPAIRATLLDELYPELRSEVESLLSTAAEAESKAFLNDPYQDPETALQRGARVGSYEVLEELGRGGMGVVYKVARVDGQFQRDSALKVVASRILAPDAERRFRRESQILAQLDHPNIVRLLDGGLNGRQPYIVMELVSGDPLTQYVKDRELSLHQRLRLFCDACSAIHYAHQRLVIHRDLKPKNLLVTGDGILKVLDFGIAQVLTGTPEPSGTATHLHPMSLECASPEQVRGQPVSMATDVYALGVLLYELATGVNPQYAPGMLFDECIRRITGGDGPPAVTPPDLDAISSKAMAKDPSGRYASVAELQADVERFLSGLPVSAVRPGFAYVATKLVRRHRALSVTALALLVALTAGATLFVRQSRFEAKRFEDARKLIHAVIFDIQPKLESIPSTLPLRQSLIAETMRYLEAVSQDAGGNVPLLLELAGAYVQMARIQGYAMGPNMGKSESARRSLARAESLIRSALQKEPSNSEVIADAAVIYSNLTQFDIVNLDVAAGEEHSRKALEFAETLAAPATPQSQRRLADAYYDRGGVVERTDADRGLIFYERALSRYENLLRGQPKSTELARRVIVCEWRIAENRISKSEWSSVPRHAIRSLELADEVYRRNPDDARSILQLGSALLIASRTPTQRKLFPESLPMVKRAVDLRRGALRMDPGNAQAQERLAAANHDLALVESGLENWPKVRDAADEAITIYRRLLEGGVLKPYLALGLPSCHFLLAQAHSRQGQRKEACSNIRESLRLYQIYEPHYAGRRDFLNEMSKVRRTMPTMCDADRTATPR